MVVADDEISEQGVTRGEVWWAYVDERCPVVFLSRDGSGKVRAIMIVAPASTNLDGHAIEVRVGTREGLPLEGVLRVALLRPGRINCNWLITLSQAALLERVGVLSPEKLRELDRALRLGGLESFSSDVGALRVVLPHLERRDLTGKATAPDSSSRSRRTLRRRLHPANVRSIGVDRG